MATTAKVLCAVYTRKSTEEGLNKLLRDTLAPEQALEAA